jgi:hypothetical protein
MSMHWVKPLSTAEETNLFIEYLKNVDKLSQEERAIYISYLKRIANPLVHLDETKQAEPAHRRDK